MPHGAGTDSRKGFDLGPMKRLMARFGNPQSKLKVPSFYVSVIEAQFGVKLIFLCVIEIFMELGFLCRLFILLGLKGRDLLLRFCLVFCGMRGILLVLIPVRIYKLLESECV